MSSEVGLTLPQEVISYYEKLQQLDNLRQEVNQLKKEVSLLMKTIPDRTIIVQDSKIRLQDVKKKSPLNEKHLLLRLTEFVLQNWKATPEEVNRFAIEATDYVMRTRKESITTRLLRTNNNKNKRKLERIIQFTPNN